MLSDSDAKIKRQTREAYRAANEEETMKQSQYQSYDELPLFLNAKIVADVLGVSPSSGYELMREKGFPALKVGSRIVVPRDKFIAWVERESGGGSA